MSEAIRDKIIKIIEKADVVVDINDIVNGATFDDADIDSLDLMNVFLGIEQEFEIKIPDDDIDMLSTLDAITQYVSDK